MTRSPIGMAMLKHLTLQTDNCPHRKYLPRLIEMVQGGKVYPTRILSNVAALSDAVAAYEAFDRRKRGWVKVELRSVS